MDSARRQGGHLSLEVARSLATLPRRLARRWLPGLAGAPLLSVVVEVHNSQEELGHCLDSVLGQTLERIELVVVDHGSTDHSPEILNDYADRDPRLRVITLPDHGSGAARNAGVAAATAPFLAFVGTHDVVAPEAYAHLVDVLQHTGSDFAVGAVLGRTADRRSWPRWVTDVHRVERRHISIEDFPDALQDAVSCNRVFRRDFWNDRIGAFPTGIALDDQVSMVTAYVRATAFDLLPAVTSRATLGREQQHGWPPGHQLATLQDRVAANELAWQVVSSEASPRVFAAWLGRVLDSDLSRFVNGARQAGDEYRQLLQDGAARFIDRADTEAWRHVRVERKLRLALAAAGEWRAAEELIERFRVDGPIPQTTVDDGRVFAQLPAGPWAALDRTFFELSDRQTALRSCLRSVRWQPDGRLLVDGWAFISGVDLGGTPLELSARLHDRDTDRTVELSVQRFRSAAVSRWAGHLHQDYDDAGFRLVVDVDALPATEPGASTRWQLVLEAQAAGVRRAGQVRSVDRTGVATRMRARDLTHATDPHRIVPYVDGRHGFVLHVRNDRLRALSLESVGPHQLRGRLGVLRPPAAPLRYLVLRQNGKVVVRSRLRPRADGGYDFSITVPTRDRAPHFDVRVQDSTGRLTRMSWPAEATAGSELGPYGPGTARWRRSPRGFVQVSSQPLALRAHAVQVLDEGVTVDVSLHGMAGHATGSPGHRPGPDLGLRPGDRSQDLVPAVLRSAQLRSPLAVVDPSTVEPLGEGRFRLLFGVQHHAWGSETERPLPSGGYTVELMLPGGRLLSCDAVPELMEQLPFDSRTSWQGVTVARRPGTGRLTIELRPPLGDDERGPLAQQRLTRWFAETDFELRDSVFFQCFRGEFATDSQLAIHQELHRRGAGVELVWGVADLSVQLPAGARPVVFGSRDWYEAIGSSRYLCNNNDFDRFFFRRPGQRFLQTFHGYPFKSMGVSFWHARQLSEEAINYECSRRTDAWTSILIPEAFCEELYRQEYRYEGEVLLTGYPRNDAVVNSDAATRATVLRRLGVSPDKTVVMYAPTWRDTIATGDWSAKFFDALQLDELAEALGPDHVILLRGHNFNMRQGVLRPSHSQIVDVTRYPEITDLILAADVAVLDYSSLRFDWVLTGKPVLFFVPDLADYLSARTALFEYGPSAPGPLLSTTAEVIAALQDIESVSKDYVGAREEFNERFNRLHDGRATARVVDAFFGPVAGESER